MDVSLTPQTELDQRRTRRSPRLPKTIMQANGMTDKWFTGHSPVWGDEQIAIRDNAFVEAQAQSRG